MEALTQEHERAPEQASPSEPGVSPAEPRTGGEDDTREGRAVEAFARGHEGLTEDDERDALDFLLAPKPQRQYGVKVAYDTEAGERPLIFVIRGVDGRRLDSIEQSARNETTGNLDVIGADCMVVAEGTAFLETPAGRRVELTSAEFLTVRRPAVENPAEMVEHKLASPAMALEARFRTQLGLISGVAREIRRVSGYDGSKVGAAQRRLVDAAGNS